MGKPREREYKQKEKSYWSPSYLSAASHLTSCPRGSSNAGKEEKSTPSLVGFEVENTTLDTTGILASPDKSHLKCGSSQQIKLVPFPN